MDGEQRVGLVISHVQQTGVIITLTVKLGFLIPRPNEEIGWTVSRNVELSKSHRLLHEPYLILTSLYVYQRIMR